MGNDTSSEVSDGMRRMILYLASSGLSPSAIAWRLHRMGLPGKGPAVRAVLRDARASHMSDRH